MYPLLGLTKSILPLALFLGLCGCNVPAEVTRLPADALTALHKEHDFITIKRVSQIPAAGLAAFQAGQDDHDYKMADPKGKFQLIDVGADKSLPTRQLQFAALSPDYLLIHHARGGVALGYYFVLLKKSGDSFKLIWLGEGSRCTSFHRFVKALKTKTIDDRPGYAY